MSIWMEHDETDWKDDCADLDVLGELETIYVDEIGAVDRDDPDASYKVRGVEDKIISTFDFHGIYVDYDEDFIGIITREI